MEMRNNKNIKAEPTQVRHTGDWSADSKLASINNGYWEDPYFKLINERSGIPNRTSLICRGYYVRFRVCDYFLRNIINSISGPFQIVSLGSGMDTTYFRLAQDYGDRMTGFFEVDFPTVTVNKNRIIQSLPELSKLAEGPLRLVPADLRCLDAVLQALESANIVLTQKTIFYSECVVNYLKPSESEAILPWITSQFKSGVWLAYEQCFPNDTYGQIMVEHFRKNGCPILSINCNGSMSAQLNQLKKANFKTCHVFNAWDSFIRITNNEGSPIPAVSNPQQQFDEHEALVATCLHYSVRIGITSKLSIMESFQFLDDFSSEACQTDSYPATQIRGEDVFTCSSIEHLRGQASVVIDDMVLSVGGCDQTSRIVPFLIEFRVLNLGSKFSVISQRTETAEVLHRMYSTAVFVPGNNSVMFMGGRKSPLHPRDCELVVVSAHPGNEGNSSVFNNFSVLVKNDLCPSARWRHGMIHYIFEDKSYLFLFGGKTSDTTGRTMVLGDFWRYSVSEGHWALLNPQHMSRCPSPRHSHSMCLNSNRSSIYLIGGVSADDTRLCEDALWEYNYGTNNWTEWVELNSVARKLGHVAVVHQNTLLILGGYGNQADCRLECFITSINLESKVVQRYELPFLDNGIRFLPFGFSAHVVRPKEKSEEMLFIFGGGGNCFSFGSHYNKCCLLIKLPLSP